MKKFSEIHLLSSIAIVFFPFPFFPIPSLRDRVMMQSSIYNSLQMCFVILFTRIYLVGLFENFMEVSRIIYSECFLVMKQRSLVQTFLFPSPWGQNSLILKRKKKEIFAGHALGLGSIDTSFGGAIPVSDTGHIYDTFACVS